MFTDRELATILASLRTAQAIQQHSALDPEIAEIASAGGTLEPLDDGEVDALCERLNATPSEEIAASAPSGSAKGLSYWIATVSDEDGLYASDLIWGDYHNADDVFDMLADDVKAESARLNLPVEWHGMLTLPRAS